MEEVLLPCVLEEEVPRSQLWVEEEENLRLVEGLEERCLLLGEEQVPVSVRELEEEEELHNQEPMEEEERRDRSG